MKALILALLGLTVLAGCATTPDNMKVATTKKLPSLPASTGFCNANDGVFVVLLGTDGKLKKFACPSNGNKTITQPDKIIDHQDGKLVKSSNPDDLVKFGESQKWILPGTTDPCYVWYIGGSRHHICWE